MEWIHREVFIYDRSGGRDIRGHISKRGPSMLRFVLVTASHTAIKRSKKLRSKYLSIVRRVGKNRAIVAIARILAELIHSMLKNCTEFVDRVDSLTEAGSGFSTVGKKPLLENASAKLICLRFIRCLL